MDRPMATLRLKDSCRFLPNVTEFAELIRGLLNLPGFAESSGALLAVAGLC
jgi:hypothetical protein